MLTQLGDTILLLEDEEAEILLVQQAVAGFPGNMRLVVVRDTLEAQEWLADNAARGYRMPCLILLDLKLPKLAGLGMLRTLRMDKHLQDAPIVVFSELHEPADVVLSYQIGANSFVKKPADLAEFTRLLHEMGDRGWLGDKRAPKPCASHL